MCTDCEYIERFQSGPNVTTNLYVSCLCVVRAIVNCVWPHRAGEYSHHPFPPGHGKEAILASPGQQCGGLGLPGSTTVSSARCVIPVQWLCSAVGGHGVYSLSLLSFSLSVSFSLSRVPGRGESIYLLTGFESPTRRTTKLSVCCWMTLSLVLSLSICCMLTGSVSDCIQQPNGRLFATITTEIGVYYVSLCANNAVVIWLVFDRAATRSQRASSGFCHEETARIRRETSSPRGVCIQ